MLIVDAQVHIWKANTPERPWIEGIKPQLPEPMGLPELRSQMAAAGVNRAVIIPPNWEGLRNDYAAEASATFPNAIRYIGRLDIDRDDARQQLSGWMEAPGMLGMRQSFLAEYERERLIGGVYDWFFRDAEAYGIPVMLHAADLRAKLEDIASRHPRLTIILAHMGLSTGIAREGRYAEALANTTALARFPNVHSTLSSVPLHSREKYPFRDMHDYVHGIIEAFGPRRCFWASDLTHMLHSCSYREGVSLFTEELKLAPGTLDFIMGRSICEKLGWT